MQFDQVRLSDDVLNNLYEETVDTHWLGVGIVTEFAVMEPRAAGKTFVAGDRANNPAGGENGEQ